MNARQTASVSKKQFILPPKTLIGVLHLSIGDGRVLTRSVVDHLAEQMQTEAEILVKNGFAALLIVCQDKGLAAAGGSSPEIVAVMTAIILAIKNHVKCDTGVQYLNGGNRETLAIAIATNSTFIRVQGFHTISAAAPLLNYRNNIEGEGIALVAEIFAGEEMEEGNLIEATKSAAAFGADAVILSNHPPDKPVDRERVRKIYTSKQIPIWIGSGVSSENLMGLWSFADAFIVDALIRKDNRISEPVDPGKITRLNQTLEHLKHSLAT